MLKIIPFVVLATTCFAGTRELEVRVRTTAAGPQIHVDGKPVPPRFYFYWGYNRRARAELGTDWRNFDIEVTPERDMKGAWFQFGFGEMPAVTEIRDVRVVDSSGSDVIPAGTFADESAFSGIWSVTPATGKTNVVFSGGVLKANLRAPGPRFQLRSKRLALERDETYHLLFQARSDVEHSIRAEAWCELAGGGQEQIVSREQDMNMATLRTVADAGVELVEIGIAHSFLDKVRERERWTAFDGPDDWTIADEQVRRAIAAHPNGKFVLRLIVNAPDAVLASNPDWCMKFEDDAEIKGPRMASPSCRPYREAVCAYLKRAVKHFRETFPNHYAGIHPSGQNSGEWFYDKTWTRLSGYDPHTLAAWREWLAAHGEPDAASAEVPTPEERRAKDDGSDLLDPVKRRRVILFNRFLQEEMSDFVAEMALACREASGEGKLVVFFYGYAWEFNSLPNGPSASGHYGLMRLLEKAPGAIDILCGPIGYFNRRYPDGFAPVMSAAETLARHGILWLNEDDTRTHLDPRRHVPVNHEGTLTTCANMRKVMLRNTSQEAIRGLGSWWMDLYGHGWHDDPALWEVQRRLWPSERALLTRPRPYTPDVAAIVGEGSQLHYSVGSTAVTRPLLCTVRAEFDKAGVKYGQYLLEDVLKNPPAAKVQFFLSANYLTDDMRAALAKDRRDHPDRVRVWCYAPGYLSERGADEKGITDVTGFRVRRIDKLGDAIRPLFSPEEEGGEVWARFPDGSPSVVVRPSGAGMDVFCATPELTADIIRRAAKAAGVHLYLKSGNAGVYADAGFVSVQALEDGEVTIDFGEMGDVIDAMTGEKVGTGPVCDFALKAGDARLFRVSSTPVVPGTIYHDGWIDFNKNGVKDVYEDPSRPVDARVADLLSQMTLEEKTCQLATLYGSGRVLKDAQPTAAWANEIWKDGIGNIDEELNGVGKMYQEHPELICPYSNHVAAVNAIQRWFVEKTRLGVPVDFSNEGIHGLNHTKATPLPAPIGIGATWNRALVRRAGEIVGEEAKLIGYSNVYAPILDVARDQRWGRTLECYGEDPYLVGRLGAEMVRGIQSRGVASTLKHFVAYGVPKGGRDGACRTDPHVAPRELHEIHLAPFAYVIRTTHPMGVMCSYNDWNGEPVVSSRYFLTDLLRGEYGFDGYVVSDSAAVEFLNWKHAVAETWEEVSAQALEAGLNVRTHFTPPEDFILPTRAAVKSGRLPVSVVDQRVAEVLSVKFRLGLFDNPFLGDAARADKAAGMENHLDFADRIQAESLVLLKNDGILPLDKSKVRKILVAGPLAADTSYMVSRYGPNGNPLVTVLDGLRAALGEKRVVYAQGCETVDADWPESEIVPVPLTAEEMSRIDAAVAAAADVDVIVVVLGEDEQRCGECRSRTSLELPGRQQILLERLHATGKPVVLVLVNGQPLTVNWADRNVAAILETWFPGARGGREIAKALFGETNPSGRLSVTFPKTVGQIEYNFPFKKGSHGRQPRNDDPNGTGKTRVQGALYPFGYGLSYTTFAYSELTVEPVDGAVWKVSCRVENTGRRAGAEVVQLYVRDLFSSVVTYDSVLRGFEKVELERGESKRVDFVLTADDLAILDKDMQWTVEPGDFEIMIGASSEDIRLKTTVKLGKQCADRRKTVRVNR